MKYEVKFEEINTRNPMTRKVIVDTKSQLDAKKVTYKTFGGMKKIKITEVKEAEEDERNV